MMEPRGLSQAEIEAFGRDGFVVVRGLFDGGEMARIGAWTDEVEHWPEVPGRHMMYFEQSLVEPAKRVLNRLENFYPYHPDFAALCDGDQLLGSVSALLAEPAVLFKEKINFKLPGGDGFEPHQDQQAGWSTYAPLFVTALVSIDEATVENGCLELAAGHHKAGLIGAEWTPLSQQQLDAGAFVTCPTKPGDAVFFDSYAPHGSKPNLSQRRRRVLYVTYNSARHGDHRLRYYADKRESYPPDVEREPGRAYAYRV
jgi:hypothetical protein